MKKSIFALVLSSLALTVFAKTEPVAVTKEPVKMVAATKVAVPTAVKAASAPVQAASQPAKKLTAQQQKMVDCNKAATGKKGDERKSFMSNCLKSVKK